jgi:uncharacterized lipoprotein YmbA
MADGLLYGLCLLGFLVTGCSSSVEIRYYRLEYFPPADIKQERERLLDNIAVENFRSTSPLRRQEVILYRDQEKQLAISSHNLWWSLPEEMVSEAIKEYLTAQGAFQHVLAYPTSHPVRYCLEGTVKQFEIHTSSEGYRVQVALQMALVDREKNEIIWEDTLDASQASPSNFQAASLSMREALHKIFARLLEKVYTIVQSRKSA